jgi:hypothetical protein
VPNELHDIVSLGLLRRRIVDCDIGTLASESDRGGSPHACIAADDERLAAQEPAGGAIAARLPKRPRPHPDLIWRCRGASCGKQALGQASEQTVPG